MTKRVKWKQLCEWGGKGGLKRGDGNGEKKKKQDIPYAGTDSL